MSLILPSKSAKGHVVSASGEKSNSNDGEKTPPSAQGVHDMEASERMQITDEEWSNASRAMRTATWAAIFYCALELSYQIVTFRGSRAV